MQDTIKVSVIEDNPHYREVISLALEDEKDIHLISEFGTAEVALRELQAPKNQVTPDLILLDLQLPSMSGLESIPFIKRIDANVKIIILTQSDSEANILRAISEGADGYLLKSASLEEITTSIREVMADGSSLDPSVAKFILQTLKQQLPQTLVESTLTNREIEILEHLADGLVKKEIATALRIGYSTVDSHVSNIYKKLNVKNAPAAVSKAFRQGIL
ncbi:response regulator [Rubritalea marina]|uniref:response regulator n=1 Tax=Rubritalea marina TaxID=361055 RepID=UPI00036D306E|nr:response regulator transcription factor [Rubritalea marina]